MSVGLVVLVVVLVVSGVFALVRTRTDGRVRTAPAPAPVPASDDEAPAKGPEVRDRLTSDDIGTPLGAGATVVQLSSAFCAPCRAARVVLDWVADQRDDVTYVDVDAESHLDLVRRLNVLRTPTVLVLDADGVVVGRVSGVPRIADIQAVLDSVAGPISDRG